MQTDNPTPVDIEALEAAAKAATWGPWAAASSGSSIVGCVPIYQQGSGRSIGSTMWCPPAHPAAEGINAQSLANAAHIAAADPTTVLAMIEEMRRLRGALREANERLCEHGDLTSHPLRRKILNLTTTGDALSAKEATDDR